MSSTYTSWIPFVDPNTFQIAQFNDVLPNPALGTNIRARA